MTVLDRFLKYVTFDTQSNEETGTTLVRRTTCLCRGFGEGIGSDWYGGDLLG